MRTNRFYIYLLSFLEGGAVMACELLGAKMLAPYFGTSLYVWAAALGLTLGGLMSGYFLGGIVSRRFANNEVLLYWLLVLAGCALFAMPFTSKWVMELTLGLNLQLGAMLSLLVFMFPPLVFMGMVSPVIINILTESAKEAGSRAGTVYAISTLGGILTTFLMGFYVIPEFGLKHPAIAAGLLLALLPAISLFRMKNKMALPVWGLLLALGVTVWGAATQPDDVWKIHYHSEGVLGQVKVIDFQPFEDQPQRSFRGLVVNNTLQTVLELGNPDKNFWHYTEVMVNLISQFPKGSKVLVLGMGGGTLVRQLVQAGYEVEAVEIDGRLEQLAKQYFNLPDDVPVFLDDARHFIKTTPSKYDVIIYDTFRGESAPEHVLTLESLADTRDNLLPGGWLLVNFYGYWESERGAIGHAVFKTLSHAGFQTKVVATEGSEDDRNLVFWSRTDDGSLSAELTGAQLGGELLPVSSADTLGAVVLTDEQPQLRLYARAAAQWRKLYNDFYTKQFSRFKFF